MKRFIHRSTSTQLKVPQNHLNNTIYNLICQKFKKKFFGDSVCKFTYKNEIPQHLF